MSLWSRDASSRETLFIYLQVEITGQIVSAKGLEIHLLLVCNLSRILEKPISKPTEMGAINFNEWEKCSDESVFSPPTAALYH